MHSFICRFTYLYILREVKEILTHLSRTPSLFTPLHHRQLETAILPVFIPHYSFPHIINMCSYMKTASGCPYYGCTWSSLQDAPDQCLGVEPEARRPDGTVVPPSESILHIIYYTLPRDFPRSGVVYRRPTPRSPLGSA